MLGEWQVVVLTIAVPAAKDATSRDRLFPVAGEIIAVTGV
jgi:hypothetical protein